MKVLNFVSVLMISSVLTSVSVFGENIPNSTAKAAESSVREQIASTLNNSTVENLGEVNIYFSVTPGVGFELKNVTGADAQLAEFVKNKLTNTAIVVPAGLNGSYTLKVRFTDHTYVVEYRSSEEILRNAISTILSGVDGGNGSVTLFFSVSGNKLNVKKVEGDNKSLVNMVATTLEANSVGLPTEMTGNYKIDVKF